MTNYVVTAPRVVVKTMTHDGPRMIGLFAGAPWPADADPAATQHHLDNDLIVAVEDPRAVNVDVPPLERIAGVKASDQVREQEAALNRHRGAVKAAETRKANEDAAAKPAVKAQAAPAAGVAKAPEVK
jgi:hypothetical protein